MTHQTIGHAKPVMTAAKTPIVIEIPALRNKHKPTSIGRNPGLVLARKASTRLRFHQINGGSRQRKRVSTLEFRVYVHDRIRMGEKIPI